MFKSVAAQELSGDRAGHFRLENNRVVQVPTISQVLTLTMLSHPHTQPLTLKERQVGAKTLKCLGCCDLHKDLWPTWAWEFVAVIKMCDYYLESLPFPFPGLDSACTICPHRLSRAGQTVWAPGSTLLPVSDSRHQRLITPPSRVFHHAVSPTRGAWCHFTSSQWHCHIVTSHKLKVTSGSAEFCFISWDLYNAAVHRIDFLRIIWNIADGYSLNLNNNGWDRIYLPKICDLSSCLVPCVCNIWYYTNVVLVVNVHWKVTKGLQINRMFIA